MPKRRNLKEASLEGPVDPAKPPKNVPRSVRIGQQGINLIERVIGEMGHLWTPTQPASDAGTDGYIELCTTDGGATGQIVQVQSKATYGQFKAETSTEFIFICDERDLVRWMGGNAPFILVVSRPPTAEAYWIPIKSYFKDPAILATRTVRFDKSAHSFNRSVSKSLLTLAVSKAAGIYSPTPPPRDESLFTNLVPVSRYSQTVYFARSTFREPEQFVEALKKHEEFPRREWLLKDQGIYSFHDLSQTPWCHVCDAKSIAQFPSDEWALSDDRELRGDFVRLLNFCLTDHLARRRVKYSKGKPAFYYFRPTENLEARLEKWRALKKHSTRSVFEGHKGLVNTDTIAYYRHLAFIPYFRRFSSQWYLEVTPTYHFTRDGIEHDRFGKDRLSGIKRIEKNAAVFASMLFWTRFIVGQDDFFRRGNEFLTFSDVRQFDVDFGVPEEDWKTKAEGDELYELAREGGEELLLDL